MGRVLNDEEIRRYNNGEPFNVPSVVVESIVKHYGKPHLFTVGYVDGTEATRGYIDIGSDDSIDTWLDKFHKKSGFTPGERQELRDEIISQREKLSEQAIAGDAENNGKPHREPVLIELEDVEETSVHWIWDKWLPEDSIAVLDGDPGTGKSQITVDLAARITTGRPLPPLDGDAGIYDPRNVVFLTLEDDPSKVLRPRLRVAGADVSRVSLLAAVRDSASGDESPIDLYSNIPQLEAVIKGKRPALVIVDPITSFAGGMDLNKDTEARSLLQPVLTLANEAGTTFLFVRHLNKKEGMSALYRGGGSIGGIIGICRAGWIVHRSPSDRDGFVLAMNKSNYAKFPKSLMYSIESVGDTSRVAWQGESELTAGELMGKKREPSKVEACAEFLRDKLSGAKQIASAELQRMAEAADFPVATYKRARKVAGVIAEHDSSFDGGWVSFIPEAEAF